MAAADPPLSPFYTAAPALLVGLLIWLYSVAKARRDEREGSGTGADGGTLLLLVAAVLAVSALIGMRVLYRESAGGLETTAVGVGFAVGVSFVVYAISTLLPLQPIVTRSVTLKALRRARLLIAVASGLIVGYVAAPPGKPLAGARYQVYGTCLAGNCGLIQRVGPGSDYAEDRRVKRYEDEDFIRVVCQADGRPPEGRASRVWDRLSNGRYVSDLFVLRRGNGEFSRALPRCESKP